MIQGDIGTTHSDESVEQRPNEVLTDSVWPSPGIFRKACDVLAFFQTSDMFGAQTSHQVPRYFSEDETDMDAAGTDVFSTDWTAESSLYFCSSWAEITPTLENIAEEGVTCMVVVPERVQALWWLLFESLRTDWLRCVRPVRTWRPQMHFAVPVDYRFCSYQRPRKWSGTGVGVARAGAVAGA